MTTVTMTPDTPVSLTEDTIQDALAACRYADRYWRLCLREAEGGAPLMQATTYTVAECNRYIETFEELERQLWASIEDA